MDRLARADLLPNARKAYRNSKYAFCKIQGPVFLQVSRYVYLRRQSYVERLNYFAEIRK